MDKRIHVDDAAHISTGVHTWLWSIGEGTVPRDSNEAAEMHTASMKTLMQTMLACHDFK